MTTKKTKLDDLVNGKTVREVIIYGYFVEIYLTNGTTMRITGGIDQGHNVVDIEIDGEDFSRN